MKFTITDKIFERFPDTCIGVVVAQNINNTLSDFSTGDLLRHSEQQVRERFEGKILSEHLSIQAWRKAYKLFRAGDYRCSAENLAKRVIKGGQLPTINNLVDLYNTVSLDYTLPVGGEDLGQVTGDILLTEASGNEQFITLLSTENDPPDAGEIVYKDETTVLCRKWNWRESDITKLTPETKEAIFFIEGLESEERERVEGATGRLVDLLEKYCEAKAVSYLLDSQRSSIELSD